MNLRTLYPCFPKYSNLIRHRLKACVPLAFFSDRKELTGHREALRLSVRTVACILWQKKSADFIWASHEKWPTKSGKHIPTSCHMTDWFKWSNSSGCNGYINILVIIGYSFVAASFTGTCTADAPRKKICIIIDFVKKTKTKKKNIYLAVSERVSSVSAFLARTIFHNRKTITGSKRGNRK